MPNTTSYQDLMDRIYVAERDWQRHANKHMISDNFKLCVMCAAFQRDLELLRDTARIAYRVG